MDGTRRGSTTIPTTVTTALEDRSLEDAICLEAGAGAGNMTRGLLASGARHVYSVTDDPEDARYVRETLAEGESERTTIVRADLRAVPLRTGTIDCVTAHGLFNLLAPAEAAMVAAEMTRVGAPGSRLVIDDYAPLPADAAVQRLFAVENATAALADGRPALTFYPATILRALFVDHGWEFDREVTLLDPVPWTRSHLDAHVDAVRTSATRLDDALAASLVSRAEVVASEIGSESAGEMYSLALELPSPDR